jgi:hypothetical protein
MVSRCLFAGIVLLLTSLVSIAQEGKLSYQALLEKLNHADTKLDFKALRLAYAGTSQYNPYDSGREVHAAILNALREKKYEQCLSHVDRALQKNYVDITVHYAAHRCHTELKNRDKARFHHQIFDGLLKSILSSGDGKSPASAYVVISPEEEYAVLTFCGLRQISQAAVKENGHSYDRIIAQEDNGTKEYHVYFNTDLPLAWLRTGLERRNK